jgi:hypothetical protein
MFMLSEKPSHKTGLKNSTGTPSQDIPEMQQHLTDAESQGTKPAHDLVACIEFTVFGGKQSLMRQFQQKVTRLTDGVDRLTASEIRRRDSFD